METWKTLCTFDNFRGKSSRSTISPIRSIIWCGPTWGKLTFPLYPKQTTPLHNDNIRNTQSPICVAPQAHSCALGCAPLLTAPTVDSAHVLSAQPSGLTEPRLLPHSAFVLSTQPSWLIESRPLPPQHAFGSTAFWPSPYMCPLRNPFP